MNDRSPPERAPKMVDLSRPRPEWLGEAQTIDENIWANRYIVAAVAFHGVYLFAEKLRRQYDADTWSSERRRDELRDALSSCLHALETGHALSSLDLDDWRKLAKGGKWHE